MRQTTWTPVYFIAQLFYFIALVRTALVYTQSVSVGRSMNEKETSSAADRTLQMNAHELLIRLVKQKAKVIAVVLCMFCFSVVVH